MCAWIVDFSIGYNKLGDYSQVMRNLGYLGGAPPRKPSLDDLEDGAEDAAESDSDDDELPDLEWSEPPGKIKIR